MSGGHFDYQQHRIGGIAQSIDELIKSNNDQTLNSWGQMVGRDYSEETIAKFKLAVKTLKKAEAMAQRIDWLVSGDDSEESFHRRWSETVSKIK